MKTLVNKNNPAIRITAPEINEITSLGYTNYEIEQEGTLPLFFNPKDWALVEEEPEKQTSKYLKEPDYDKQIVKKMSKELAKIITDQIVEPVDLEKAAEEYALSLSKSSMGGKEYCKQDFKAGAEWQKKQDEDGKALLYVNDHAYKKGFKDGKIEAMLNNELIWQDVKQIVNIADKEIEGLYRPFDKFPTEQSYYKEILKKYKEQKNK